MSLSFFDEQKIGHDVFSYRGIFWYDALLGQWVATTLAAPLPVVMPLPPPPLTGSTIAHRNINSAGASTLMFAANANRIEIIGINLGPRAITIAFGVAAVFGAGQTIPANTPFRLDTTPVAINFIDDGGAGNALISATQISTP